MFKKAFFLIFVLVMAAVLSGCPTPPDSEVTEPPIDGPTNGEAVNPRVTVVVTRDFGRELILEEKIEVEAGTSAMQALETVAEEVENTGGFVESINGNSSEGNSDWFYYINGILSNLGANEYILRDGDIEHWDLRDWSYQQFVPAIIGDFPQPFQSGFRGQVKATLLVYTETLEEETQALATKMVISGPDAVMSVTHDMLPEDFKIKSNLIIIADADSGLIPELNAVHQQLGFFAYFEEGQIIVLDRQGNIAGEFGAGYGLIQATQNPWSPGGIGSGESAVWMVTGTDDNGVRNAINVLVNNTDELSHAFAVLVKDTEIIKIP